MIQFRIDVDYPYPSRWKSFCSVFTGLKWGNDYLRNCKIIAQLINDSPHDILATWSFTYKSLPDKELLHMISNKRHRIGLHLVKNPHKELALLEKATEQKIMFYTIHGIKRRAKLLWKTLLGRNLNVPKQVKLLDNSHIFNLDTYCYYHPVSLAEEKVKTAILEGETIHIHPEWLFQRGTVNHRASYFEVLKMIC